MKNKNHILLMITTLETGGAERVCVNLANYFAEQGNHVMIGVLFHKKETIYPLDPRIRVVDMPCQRFGRIAAAILFRMELMLLGFRPDVVIAFMWHSNVFASIYAKLFHAKVILSEHSNPELANPDPILLGLGGKYFRYVSKIVVLNEGAKRFMENKMNMDSSQVVKILNPAPEKKRNNIPENHFDFPYLLAVGRLHPVKGFDRLLQMFAEVRKTHPEEHLVICGIGDEFSAL